MNIKKIVIVGGGSAGWMSAALLSSTLQKNIEIVLIESEMIGTVGVGEAAIPPIKYFNKRLGIEENEFLRATNGTFKLGIQFVDWARQGRSYFHPFGHYGAKIDVMPVHQHWLSEGMKNRDFVFDEYSMAWAMAKNSRFERPSYNPQYIQSTFNYSYHFDAGLYAKYLRAYSEARGVTRMEGIVKHAEIDKDSGFLARVVMENDLVVDGDFFIDCTGFKAKLLGEALGVGYESWSHLLPCDRAVALPCARVGELTPYTKSIARSAGWQWRIPLQSRIGNGHVYCSSYMSEDEATSVLLNNIESKALAAPNHIKFTTGHRKVFWEKNCIAVGLSAGFLEPLESTSLHLIQSAITRFADLFPRKNEYVELSAAYNRLTFAEYEEVRDFLILHYVANTKRDGGFWEACSDIVIPERLQEKINHFKSYGRVVFERVELFSTPSWLAVLLGQEVEPTYCDPVMSYRTVDSTRFLAGLRNSIASAVHAMPLHEDFIAQNCKSHFKSL